MAGRKGAGIFLGFTRMAAAHGFDAAKLQRPFLPLDHAFVGRSLEVKSVPCAAVAGCDHFAVVIDVAGAAVERTNEAGKIDGGRPATARIREIGA